ncbi:uncharacterized protein Z518_06601 [Rhinocladiella mackenziei CBS 650.93]|uniref:Uncharacterized protein n=1 Tax=Rhinocladiella mackenziei CBS 650.93 TaxID=1442369 RepID=A0A0D2IIE4_9EURO|nr:uncharacterized protein Z518_06601 [Rhinocladiella mackenziei CBS 650.93]KIX03051.1 hypothetical protein Z518_06601 [Rhinocladiella mackenziei CBS 650.93]
MLTTPADNKDAVISGEELADDVPRGPVTADVLPLPPNRYPPESTDALPLSPSRYPFFRTTLFQILVVGLCAFCAPGIWSAMNGLGVGGS